MSAKIFIKALNKGFKDTFAQFVNRIVKKLLFRVQFIIFFTKE